ncbi:DUF6600 domain-containing protein [Rhodoferax sp.]|uniref:DUF6600 domain-containing protein n=1 Tax=Rhodoferax sp. TaxID=50421 RepID=UPI0025E01C50|nr:DUF6600 domain-containing protein [Rhodoferax sp.]
MSASFLHKTAHLLGALLFASITALTASHALAQATPPGRVARLSLMEGAVSFAPAGSDEWSPAEFNRPLTSGDRLQTAPGARAELHSGSTALRINGQTALEISELDDNTTRLTLTQGNLALRVRNLYPGETLEVNTPNLAFTASQPGEYRLDVDPRYGTTGVTVRSGSGVVYGENGASRTLASQQQVRFADRQLAQEVAQNNPPRDNFDLWSFARDRAEDQSQSARYVSRDTIGYQQLDGYGDWRTDSAYGAVWFPRVTVGQWAPYQNGQWRWVAPWGWTWVDNAPWGFAPSHYGRWAQIGAQWAWVPGPMNQRPSYAPALVRFEGSNRFEQDRRVPPQGNWLPLAPGQPWRPNYPMGQRPNDNFNRPQQPQDWNRNPRDPRNPRPFDNGPTRVEPMVQPPPQPAWQQQAIPHARPEMRMQDAPRNQADLEQRAQMQRQQQMDRERQQQEQNRNQMQQQQSQREQMQRQRDASQQQIQQQQMRDQQNRQQQQPQQDRQRTEPARPMPRPQMQEPQPKPPEPYLRPLLPGQRPGDGR